MAQIAYKSSWHTVDPCVDRQIWKGRPFIPCHTFIVHSNTGTYRRHPQWMESALDRQLEVIPEEGNVARSARMRRSKLSNPSFCWH